MDIRWDTILGHEKNIAHLRRLWQEQRMPHALLFCGAEGIGKKRTALSLAAALLCMEAVADAFRGDWDVGVCQGADHGKIESPERQRLIQITDGADALVLVMHQVEHGQPGHQLGH